MPPITLSSSRTMKQLMINTTPKELRLKDSKFRRIPFAPSLFLLINELVFDPYHYFPEFYYQMGNFLQLIPEHTKRARKNQAKALSDL